MNKLGDLMSVNMKDVNNINVYEIASFNINIDKDVIKKYSQYHTLTLNDIYQYPNELKKDIQVFQRKEKILKIRSRKNG